MTDIVERLRHTDVDEIVARVMDAAADEIERLQEHSRLRAHDIITLGQEVGRLEAEIERLRALLLTVACPGGGWTGQPKDIVRATVADCVAAGVCGCIYGAGLKR